MAHHHGSANRDCSLAPLNVYWEMTQACALACRHCRAEAVPQAHPRVLTHEEGALLGQIQEFGDPLPLLILTAGDALARRDLAPAASYDSIRAVPGTFDRTTQAMRWAQELNLPLQVYTLVSAAWIHERTKAAPFTVATTEAPSYRRIRDGHDIAFGSQMGEICRAGFPCCCEYHATCEGSRTRPYVASGNVLASDSLCEYRPPRLQQ